MAIRKLQHFENLKLTGDIKSDIKKIRDLLAMFEEYLCSNIPGQTSGGMYVLSSEKGNKNGIATLGANGIIPIAQLPVVGNLSAEINARIAADQSEAHTRMTVDATKQDLIPSGEVALEANGTKTVPCNAVLAGSLIFLSPGCGNSNMRIDYANIVEGVSFDIVSSGGTDDDGLIVRWHIL